MGTPEKTPIRVLLADDHAVVRAGLRSVLAEAPDIGVVGEAADGAETLEAAARLLPDVVVLDVQMPHGGGLEILRILRRTYLRMAVLILSVHSEDVFALPFLREGAHGYLPKEDAAESLAHAVRQIHGGGRYVTPRTAERLARGLDRTTPSPPHERLSAQELLVLSLLASGRTVDQVAAELLLSPRTVHRSCSRILLKTGLPSTTAAIQYALDRDIQCAAATRTPSAATVAKPRVAAGATPAPPLHPGSSPV